MSVPLRPYGLDFRMVIFFLIRKNMYIMINKPNLHVIVLYYQNWLKSSGEKFENSLILGHKQQLEQKGTIKSDSRMIGVCGVKATVYKFGFFFSSSKLMYKKNTNYKHVLGSLFLQWQISAFICQIIMSTCHLSDRHLFICQKVNLKKRVFAQLMPYR